MAAEVRQQLRTFAARASPAAFKDFFRCFVSHLGRVLTPQSDHCHPAPPSDRWRVILSVRGLVRRDDSPKTSWIAEYWLQAASKIAGDVRELDARVAAGEAATATIDVASYQDIIDIVAQRASPMLALARRRIVLSGDAMAAVQKLRPAISEALRAALAELPTLLGQDAVSGDAPRSGSWMPNEASPCCLICKRGWNLLRRRHHCRACGILVCRQCSSCRASPDGLRQCLRCMGGGTFVSNPSMRSSGDSLTSECAPQAAGGSFVEGAAPELIGGEPSPPPGAERAGVLVAQIGAALAEEVSSPIKARPPDSCQRRLWDRVTAMEAAAAATKGQTSLAALARGALLGLLALMVRVATVVAICLSALATADDLPRPFLSIGEKALERLPYAMPRLLLLASAFALAWASTRPALFGATAAGVAAWRWTAAGGFLPWPLLADACTVHPVWASSCAAVALGVLVAAHLLGRLVYIYLTASVPIAVYLACRQLQRTFGLSDATAQALFYDSADSLMAPFLTNRFLALGGLFVKLGQWCANMAYGVPIKLQEHLKRLTDSAPADREAHVRALLEAEFGRPMDELFESFDYKPIASASIGQVHSAVLRGSKGKKVAVKLQHENIVPIMHADLRALKRIIRFVAWLGGDKWKDTLRMLEAWSADMLYELDFEHEAQNLREVRAGLAAAGVDVVVPVELEGWVSRHAFVMEFCAGFRFTDPDLLALHGVDRMALGARALHATACQLLELGLFNSDPHSGNLLCQVRGDTAIPVLLDFGNCIRLPEAQRLAYCRLLVALSEMSVTKSREALDKIGLITTQSGSHPERDLEFMLLMFRDTGSRSQQDEGKKEFFRLRREQRKADYAALGANTKAEQKKAKKQVQRFPTQFPDEFILFIRMMHLVRGLCTQLGAELPFLRIFEQHARRALASRQPPALRARQLMPPEEPLLACGGEALAAKAAELRRRLRVVVAQACLERQGLGLQVCVYVGKYCVVDECGGVLGSVDPRPMTCATPIPLADLSRLPLLLAACTEARAGRLNYGAPLAPLFGGDASATGSQALQLRHALAHVALAPPSGADGHSPRAALAKISAGELSNATLVCQKLLAALDPSPPGNRRAAHLPIGAGYAAAAALQASCGLSPQAALRRLQGYSSGELCFGPPVSAAPVAELSSALFADVRSALGAGGSPLGGAGLPASGGNTFLGALGSGGGGEGGGAVSPASTGGRSPVAGAEGGSPTNGGGSPTSGTARAGAGAGMRSAVSSILDVAGGLLIDPALADSAVAAVSSGDPAKLCPDLSGAASARALAAVLAAAEPAAEVSPIVGREASHGDSGISALLAGITAPRAWDERGFEAFAPEDAPVSSPAAAVGLQSGGGLLGAALQWRKGDAVKAPVTAVVLTNELSLAAVPGRLLSEVVAVFGLSPLACLHG